MNSFSTKLATPGHPRSRDKYGNYENKSPWIRAFWQLANSRILEGNIRQADTKPALNRSLSVTANESLARVFPMDPGFSGRGGRANWCSSMASDKDGSAAISVTQPNQCASGCRPPCLVAQALVATVGQTALLEALEMAKAPRA